MKSLTIGILLLLSSIKTSIAQIDNVGVYAFGHSLIDHATANGHTNIMYWMNDIVQSAGHTFSAGGQYGFLTGGLGHDNLPPSSNWGYPGITSVWDSGTQSFGASNINNILITAANFIQYELPSAPHPLNANSTAIQATETIFDWVNQEQSDMKYYIYLNWPEMNLQNDYPGTPPTAAEVDDFYAATVTGTFPDWWIAYQDGLLVSRPAYNTRLIPVGPIISKIMTDLIPNQIPFTDLYEDSAPHGKPTIYFLAGMISYMALYQEQIPTSYMPSNEVHSVIRDNLTAIRNFVWTELNAFNLPSGESRVFYPNGPLAINSIHNFSVKKKEQDNLIYWTLTNEADVNVMAVERSSNTESWTQIDKIIHSESKTSYSIIDSHPLQKAYYRIKFINFDSTVDYSEIVFLERKDAESFIVFPNPSSNQITIRSTNPKSDNIKILITDITGAHVARYSSNKGDTAIDISTFPIGLYFVTIMSDYLTETIKIERN